MSATACIPVPHHVPNGGDVIPLTRDDSLYDDVTKDPRGLFWVWEPPNQRASYVMGIDPTMGITGWDRDNRVTDDVKTDNGAIEVLKVGHGDPGSPHFIPDVQVAEYAAPIDPEELANVANIIGRMFAGNNEDGQCLAIIEIYPGPGLLTQRRMLNTYGYTNHFVHKLLDATVSKPTARLGWTANPKSVRDLWIRTKRHILRGGLTHHSPWLVEEWTDCEVDFVKQTGQALTGHDDRVRAVNMALWAAHEWSFDVETRKEEVDVSGRASWQASDMSADEMGRQWEERWAELGE